MADPFPSAYSFLAPNPDSDYGTYLPFAKNQVGSPSWVQNGNDTRPAMPDMMRSALQGAVGMGQSTQTGSLTPEALASLTLGSMGAGFMGAPRGALASGGARASLEGDRLGSRVMEPGGARQFRDLNTPDNDNLSRQQYQAILDWAASRRGEPAFSDIINKSLYQNEANEQWRRALAKPTEVAPIGFHVRPPGTVY